MYAAPVQVNVQARKLIDSFERGEVTRETEEDEEEGQKLAYPEMSSRELALPGTARKRMMELEKLKREAEERVREKPALSTRKLSEVTRETEEDEEDGQKAAYPEMSSRELALPGTAKKRLMELERLKKEAEEREKEKTTTSTKKLSEQMYGDFAHDRMKVGSGVSRANYGSKDGLEHPRVKGESAKEHREVFTHGDRNRHEDRSHHEERHQVSKHEERGDHKEHREVFSHEERSHLDGADRGGKTRVLVVTSSGTGAESVLDKELVDNVVRILKDEDHEVDVTDLSHTREHPVDYSLDRSRLKEAQLVIFHFRPILHTVPAGLVAWLQKVLVEHFAFDRRNGRIFDNGLLKGKRSLLLVTLSEEKAEFDGDSLLGDFSQYLWPIQNGILRYVGFSVLTPHLTFGLNEGCHGAHVDEATEALTGRLRNVLHEKPVFHGPK